jgi:hypothetical protein
MDERPTIVSLVTFCIVLCSTPALGLRAGFVDAEVEIAYSKEFIRDYQAASEALHKKKSIEPMLELLKKYKRSEEIAELEISIGQQYGQCDGIIDYPKSVSHLSSALRYKLPENTYIQVLMWRGNAFEIQKKHNEALKDYLRGLVTCSHHDLSGVWPKSEAFNVHFDRRSDKFDDVEAERDFWMYERRIRLQQELRRQRYYFVDLINNLQDRFSIGDEPVLKILEGITPDVSRCASIMKTLNSENKRPWS